MWRPCTTPGRNARCWPTSRTNWRCRSPIWPIDTLATIGGMLDDGLAPTNPLDVWGTGADTRNLFGSCLRAMADDPGVGVTALAVDLVTEFDGDTAYADAVLDVANSTDAPLAVLASVPSAIDAPSAQRLRDNGIPVLEGFRSGLAALGHLARWPLPVDRPAEPTRTRTANPRWGLGVRTAGGLRDPRCAIADRSFDWRSTGGGRRSSAIRWR